MALRACRKLMRAVEAASGELNDNEADEEENDDAFSMGDEDSLITHMMNCVALLAAMQSEERDLDIPVNLADARMVRNKVFVGAISVVLNSLMKIDKTKQAAEQTTNAAVDHLMEAFSAPEETPYLENNIRDGWLPLHWAVVLASSNQHSMTSADVKILYALDPMAIQMKHIDSDYRECFTPIHLLCLSPVTPNSMQLVRSFSLCSPAAFGSTTTVSALHVACGYGTPTVELLQHLLQLDSSQAKIAAGSGYKRRPLGQLCSNLMKRSDELPNADDLVNCLLNVDKSKEVVGDAMAGCVVGYYHHEKEVGPVVDRLYRMIETLLKANPDAAKYRDLKGYNLLHLVYRMATVPSKRCIDIMKLILALHKDAVREVGSGGELPAHKAASTCDVEVLEFLLCLYPEAATMVMSDGRNLLHQAVENFRIDRAVVQYLCSRYPAMIQQRKDDGLMPVHKTAFYRNPTTALALYEAGGVEQFKTPIAHPTNANYYYNGQLPLHVIILTDRSIYRPGSSFISERADMFRWLLRIYPEAAGIEGGVGANKKTPYQIALRKRMPDYFLRLLLRAAPTLNPAELHRLNYAERRMAMFLAFKAMSSSMEVPLLVRLRGESKDLVQRVVSFL